MGDTADMMIEGILCQQCGVYIDDSEAEGFPRNCSSCEPKRKKKMDNKYNDFKDKKPTTGDNAVKGVTNFLIKSKMDKEDLDVIQALYAKEIDMNQDEVTRENVSEEIQKDFGKFVKWFKKTYKS